MEKAYKFRIYPNKIQRELLAQTFGNCRFVYNYFLAKKQKLYADSKKSMSYNQCCAELTKLKKEFGWLCVSDKFALQNALRDLDTAYTNFFKKRADYPKFKDCAKHPHVDEAGYVLYYTNQCPFNAKYVPIVEQTAKENGIPFKAIHIESKEQAQNAPTPITTYALFCDGDYITNEQMNGTKFLKLVSK